MTDETKPFPFPFGYTLNPLHKLADRSIKDYIKIFEARRTERPAGKLALADVQEIMRLAEDLGDVDTSEVACIRDLTQVHPDYFKDEAQKQQLVAFANSHEALRTARKDDIAKDLVGLVPLTFFREPQGLEFISKTLALSAALKTSEAFHELHDTFDPDLLHKVNLIAADLRQLADGLTLTDIDKPGRDARASYWRDITNALDRTTGHTHHESEFKDGKWVNWNRDVTVYPQHYAQPGNRDQFIALMTQRPGLFRMAGGGHAFNISCSMGGDQKAPVGTLATLDKYNLRDGRLWTRVDVNEAIANYKVASDEAHRVVRASAGIRLRDFGKLMWAEGMSLPVAGSTDAQSLAGLIATDLHSTGNKTGFLSSQLLELTVLSGTGEPVTFTKNESIPRGHTGRWRWTLPGQTAPQELAWLPIAGALGMAGIVVEIVVKLDAKFNMRKLERFVPREWAEANIERLLDPAQQDPIFAFDHVSFYYIGGGGTLPKTIRMNGWKRTTEELSKGGAEYKTIREIFDLVGSGFLPDALARLATKQAATPGQPAGPDDDIWIASLNKRKALVLQANEAFARKLFFQHDEIEVGIPLTRKTDGVVDYNIFRNAIKDVQDLLNEEEFKSIIEVRFTPDLSEAMLGPGTGGPTCYIELATALGEFSKARIVEVYDAFDRMLRDKYNARPHLGKKSSVAYADMAATYGPIWQEFQSVRTSMDPGNRFLPDDNPFLTRIFSKPA